MARGTATIAAICVGARQRARVHPEIIALYFGANLLSPENGVGRTGTPLPPCLACHLLTVRPSHHAVPRIGRTLREFTLSALLGYHLIKL